MHEAARVRDAVRDLCERFPLPRYPRPDGGAETVDGLAPAALTRLLRPEPAVAE